MNPVSSWPELPYEEWAPTLATLHRWTQIVGKIRLAASPWINHSWHATFYVTPAGLTTGTIHEGRRSFDMEFDFCRHELVVRACEGEHRTVPLSPRTVASFYEELMAQVRALGFSGDIHLRPNEVENPIPFPEDTEHEDYDPESAARFGRALNDVARVFTEFRSRFLGKCSPVHFFWGSFDLAVTRFSGRSAPLHPGGVPGLPDWITREAYSHEVSSAGFWPGSDASPAPAFYAYGYPVPAGSAGSRIVPGEAFWSDEMREWFLPYDVVRAAGDPSAMLLDFLQSTYEAVAELGKWDRDALEAPDGYPRHLDRPS